MNAKSGTAGSPVSPAAPEAPEEADVADPGKVAEIKKEQIEKKEGKYGSEKTQPFKPPSEEDEEATKKSWIEVELVGEDDKPIPGEKYEIKLPDDTVATGTLDDKGFARIEGIEPGDCKICFPNLDKEAWEPA